MLDRSLLPAAALSIAALAVACGSPPAPVTEPMPPEPATAEPAASTDPPPDPVAGEAERKAGRGGAEASPATTPAEAQPDPEQAAKLETCKTLMSKTLECADAFLPKLVDLRVELDFPTGIAAEAKKDKQALLARAREELAVDAVDPKRTAACEAVAREAPKQELDAAAACLSKPSCNEFASCVLPVQRRRFEHMKKATAGGPR